MPTLDLNLLAALDALLAEGGVTAAARRLGLSTSAMSRTLTRLRAATGDPLLVRAGRGLVPTPRAMELGRRVHDLAREVRGVLSPRQLAPDIGALQRTFCLRAGEGFVDLFAGPLVAAIGAAAPGVSLRFVPKPLKTAEPLRDGEIDLEIGTPGLTAPELRTQLLFRDRFIGAARTGHGLLAAPVTPDRYAACRHVVASRKRDFAGPIDAALEQLGLKRQIVAIVPGFPDALRVARQTELVTLVPRFCLHGPTGSTPRVAGVSGFDLPVPTPQIAVSMFWHPRLDADPVQTWLRGVVTSVCRAATRP